MSQEIKVTTATFQKAVLESNIPVLVDFWAVWCMPCKMMDPILEQAAVDYSGKLAVAKVNVDEEPELAERFGIVSIPTMILFKGGEAAAKKVGAVPRHIVDEFLKEYVS
ncbi:MAG: thioredoxin [Spirochaetales bacterium]|nr:thioredoxin [Spirochaetales bacterium]